MKDIRPTTSIAAPLLQPNMNTPVRSPSGGPPGSSTSTAGGSSSGAGEAGLAPGPGLAPVPGDSSGGGREQKLMMALAQAQEER